MPNQEPIAVEYCVGGGRLLVLDLLSPSGEPGYDNGSVLKWVLLGNLLARSVRYVGALSTRLDYEDYMRLQESVAAWVEHQWVREEVGVDFAAGKRRWLGYPRTGFARPGGSKDATAMIFTRDGKQTTAYRTNRGRGKLRLPLASVGCRLYDEAGKPVDWEPGGDRCTIPMQQTRYLFECGNATRQQVRNALEQSTFKQSN